MDNIKNITLTFVFFFSIALTYSQNKIKKNIEKISFQKIRKEKIDSIKSIDFLTKKYSYLNNDFSINIDSAKFNKGIIDFNFHINRITKYSDSLGVVLMIELKDWDASRIAKHRITYDWKRISYFIWESEETSEKLGKSLGFTHPYRFMEYLLDEKIISIFKLNLVKNLQKEMKVKLKTKVNRNSYTEFFNLAFKENEQRKIDMELYYKEHKH